MLNADTQIMRLYDTIAPFSTKHHQSHGRTNHVVLVVEV